MGGVGAALALWPFIAALQPAEDTTARRTIFDTKNLTGIAPSLLNVNQTAVMIFRRTSRELISLNGAASTSQPRDPESKNSLQPEWARNWHRSLRPEFMICAATCTRGDCNVVRISAENDELLCPCCASRYDLAGRIKTGPAQANLRVPPHRFISTTEIEFVEGPAL